MVRRITEGFFSLFIFIFYKQIGTKFRTDVLKFFWDFFFVVFEKIGLKFDVISNNYIKLYDDIVKKEIYMAKISSKDNILVIGCGSLPATTALIAMKTKAKITTIDIDRRAVHEASIFFKNQKLEHQITVEYADGFKYPIKNFEIIFVLYGVQNQNDILNYLAENMHDTTKIIFRTVCDNQGNLSNKSINILRNFVVKDHVSSEYLGSVDSLLLLKKS
jgi:precorrin-6B methylase 2